MYGLPDALTAYDSLGPVGAAALLIVWSWYQLKKGTVSKSIRDVKALSKDMHRVRALLEELRETMAVIILIVQAMAEENPNINENAVKTALQENGHEPDDFKHRPGRSTFSMRPLDDDSDDDPDRPEVA